MTATLAPLPKSPPITADKLARWWELDGKRLELDREARQLEKERDLLSIEFQAALEAAGKDTMIRSGYRVSLTDGRASVKWKDEFVRHVGSDRANELVQAAPISKRIKVEQVS